MFNLPLLCCQLLLAASTEATPAPELVISDYTTNHPDARYIFESFVYSEDEFKNPREDGLLFSSRNDGHEEQNPHFTGFFAIYNPGEKPVFCNAVLCFKQVTREGKPVKGAKAIELWRTSFTMPAGNKKSVNFDFQLDYASDASRAITEQIMNNTENSNLYYIVTVRLEQAVSQAVLTALPCDDQMFLFVQHVSSPPPEW